MAIRQCFNITDNCYLEITDYMDVMIPDLTLNYTNEPRHQRCSTTTSSVEIDISEAKELIEFLTKFVNRWESTENE